MIKRLLAGAVLGVLGKKLYDEGKLDPYIAKAKDAMDACSGNGSGRGSRTTPKSPESQPDLAF